ncbi:MAG: calcium/sodium antiporter [Parvibaculaceae bacterium]
MDIVLVVAGLAMLFAGGEGILRGSVAIAERFQISTLLVSMVIVGFGTSAPELMVSVTAALGGTPDIAVGNVVGSNIANILLILGVAALLKPIAASRRQIQRDAFAVLLASMLLVVFALNGGVDRNAGLGMVAILAAYLSFAYLTERNHRRSSEVFRERLERDIGTHELSLQLALIFALAGLLLLAGGAYALVEGATAIAAGLGVSHAIVGLTIVAIGTSLPELATAIVAGYRGHADVVIGNVVGSNLFNILGILGVTAAITPIPIAGRIADIDVWIMLVVAVALSPVIWTRNKIGRLEGAVFLALYFVYIAWVYSVDI